MVVLRTAGDAGGIDPDGSTVRWLHHRRNQLLVPTVFSCWDNWYVNQRKEVIAKHRAVAVRYLPEIARSRGVYDQNAGEAPTWTPQQLADVQQLQSKWLKSGAHGEGPGALVTVGDRCHFDLSARTPSRVLPTSSKDSSPPSGALNSWREPRYWRNAGWLPEMGTTTSDNYNRLMKDRQVAIPTSTRRN